MAQQGEGEKKRGREREKTMGKTEDKDGYGAN